MACSSCKRLFAVQPHSLAEPMMCSHCGHLGPPVSVDTQAVSTAAQVTAELLPAALLPTVPAPAAQVLQEAHTAVQPAAHLQAQLRRSRLPQKHLSDGKIVPPPLLTQNSAQPADQPPMEAPSDAPADVLQKVPADLDTRLVFTPLGKQSALLDNTHITESRPRSVSAGQKRLVAASAGVGVLLAAGTLYLLLHLREAALLVTGEPDRRRTTTAPSAASSPASATGAPAHTGEALPPAKPAAAKPDHPVTPPVPAPVVKRRGLPPGKSARPSPRLLPKKARHLQKMRRP